MADVEELLRKMMVEYAMIRYRGNKTKIASQLGVARQHLYKPCLRELHLKVGQAETNNEEYAKSSHFLQ